MLGETAGTGKARTQKVDIYFNYVGKVDIAYTEQELEEIRAQEEQAEKEGLRFLLVGPQGLKFRRKRFLVLQDKPGKPFDRPI